MVKTSHFSKEELTTFKSNILSLIDKTKSELEDYHQRRVEMGNRDSANQSYGDDAKADQLISRSAAIEEQKTRYLQELKAALTRLQNGTYGIDIHTGEKIAKQRLLAEPTATTNL